MRFGKSGNTGNFCDAYRLVVIGFYIFDDVLYSVDIFVGFIGCFKRAYLIKLIEKFIQDPFYCQFISARKIFAYFIGAV